MMWRVYGIVSPISRMIFYVGCTSQPLERRLSQHAGDTCSAAYDSIQWMRGHGVEPEIVVIDYFEDYQEALLFETQMIITIKGLVNKQFKPLRERRLAGYMLEIHEVRGIFDGEDVVPVYRRYTDHDDVEPEFIGRAKSPDVVAEVERRAKLKEAGK